MTETEKSFRRFTPLAALLLALALTILFAPSAVAAVSRFEILPRLDSNDLKFKEGTTVSPGISFNVRIADESDRDDLNYIKIASVDVALTTTGAVEGSQTVGGITVTADIVDPSYQATVTFSGIAGVWQDEPYRLQVLGYDIGDNLIASEDITIRLYRYSAQAGPAVIPINLAAPQTPRVYPIKFLKHVSGKSATEATDFPDGSIFEFSDAPAPGDKTAWNGLEISAFGKEIQISGRPYAIGEKTYLLEVDPGTAILDEHGANYTFDEDINFTVRAVTSTAVELDSLTFDDHTGMSAEYIVEYPIDVNLTGKTISFTPDPQYFAYDGYTIRVDPPSWNGIGLGVNSSNVAANCVDIIGLGVNSNPGRLTSTGEQSFTLIATKDGTLEPPIEAPFRIRAVAGPSASGNAFLPGVHVEVNGRSSGSLAVGQSSYINFPYTKSIKSIIVIMRGPNGAELTLTDYRGRPYYPPVDSGYYEFRGNSSINVWVLPGSTGTYTFDLIYQLENGSFYRETRAVNSASESGDGGGGGCDTGAGAALLSMAAAAALFRRRG